MSFIEKHPNGSFCWMELNTTDQKAAKQFYASLFSWQPNDFPMGPDDIYTIFRLKDRDAAAACTLQKRLQDEGVPPHWMLYISCDNVDEASAKVTSLGGTVLA